MAQRRMFSHKIVSSDAFLDMPISTQALYFHLGMEADDDGFVNPKKVMRLLGASDDDLKVLKAKRFVLGFENGVIVIKHWKINNMIRKDFYQETVYSEQLKLLEVKDNKAYTEKDKIECLQNVNNLLPQDRSGKDRINKEIEIVETSSTDSKIEKKEEQFDFKVYLKKMEENPARHINVIGHFFEEKGLIFKSAKEVSAAIKRHSRSAKEVAVFSDNDIVKATNEAKKQYPELWTVETVLKILTR